MTAGNEIKPAAQAYDPFDLNESFQALNAPVPKVASSSSPQETVADDDHEAKDVVYAPGTTFGLDGEPILPQPSSPASKGISDLQASRAPTALSGILPKGSLTGGERDDIGAAYISVKKLTAPQVVLAQQRHITRTAAATHDPAARFPLTSGVSQPQLGIKSVVVEQNDAETEDEIRASVTRAISCKDIELFKMQFAKLSRVGFRLPAIQGADRREAYLLSQASLGDGQGEASYLECVVMTARATDDPSWLVAAFNGMYRDTVHRMLSDPSKDDSVILEKGYALIHAIAAHNGTRLLNALFEIPLLSRRSPGEVRYLSRSGTLLIPNDPGEFGKTPRTAFCILLEGAAKDPEKADWLYDYIRQNGRVLHEALKGPESKCPELAVNIESTAKQFYIKQKQEKEAEPFGPTSFPAGDRQSKSGSGHCDLVVA